MQQDDYKSVDCQRRQAMRMGAGLGMMGVLAYLGLMPGEALAASRAAFEAKTLSEALDALGAPLPEDSSFIKLTLPEIAENGAVVPVTVESTLSRTERIAILVDKNPTMLVADFSFPEGTEGFLTTRIRMAQTATVVVVVKANGKFYRASQEVKVTAGGC